MCVSSLGSQSGEFTAFALDIRFYALRHDLLPLYFDLNSGEQFNGPTVLTEVLQFACPVLNVQLQNHFGAIHPRYSVTSDFRAV